MRSPKQVFTSQVVTLFVWPPTFGRHAGMRVAPRVPRSLMFAPMRLLRPLLVAMLVATAVRAGEAQVPGAELTQVLVSRPALESLLTRLDQAADSRDFSGPVRDRVRRLAVLVRARLTDGDFHAGDRIRLNVEGETALTDTFTVEAGRLVRLPTIGAVPLEGVLRVELTDYLTRRLGQFLRSPKVRAQSLIRVAILGAVARQGFYTVPVDIPVNDVLMVAGGPAGTAILDQIYIERGKERLYDGEELQQVIMEGRTLDELSVQAGDRFVVPEKTQRNGLQFIQTLQILLTIPLTVLGLVRIFK